MMCGWRLQFRTGSQQLHEMRTRDDPLQNATRDHFRNSRIEFLKGIRSLIDQRIEHLSRHQPQQGTHVTVE